MENLNFNIYWLSKQSAKIYLLLGGSTGILTSMLENYGHDILKTFLLGASGALGGGLVKLLIDLIARKERKRLKMMEYERNHYEELKKKEQEENLLKRESFLEKHNL